MLILSKKLYKLNLNKMAKKGSVRGNADGVNGENITLTVLGRGTVKNTVFCREINKGKHTDFETYNRGGIDYARSKRDNSSKNNVDPI